MHKNHHLKSGQAIIFLMVVVVIGLFVVIWNFDLHRIITAKVQVRNAADAAAMAGARWQGVTLNMIGDLNLIQAAILTEAYANNDDLHEFEVPPEVLDLHDLRNRLCLFGPLAAFSVAQQAAFDNGAFNDPELAADLQWLAEEFMKIHGSPYNNLSYEYYGELLANIVAHGVAVSSYTVQFPDHPLTQEKFYTGIAYALGGVWCGLENYEYELEHYEGVDSWSKLDTEIGVYRMLDLKLREFRTMAAGTEENIWPPPRPGTAMFDKDWQEFLDYVRADERGIFASFPGSDASLLLESMVPYNPTEDIQWHVFSGAWLRTWPQPRDGEDDLEDDKDQDRFPIWAEVQDKYNYIGAETGVGISMPVHRGILATSSRETVDLEYQAKAKPFGYFEGAAQDSPPYYLGFVFPVFTDVRLIHSEIGDKQVPTEFFRHVLRHLDAYLEGGPDALNPTCHYCQLLKAWETLDREAGLEWLEDAEDMDDNPCDPDDDGSEYEGLIGGARRGS